MKRTALQRKTPLKRKTPLRSKRAKPRRRIGADPAYLAKVRKLLCLAGMHRDHVCAGRVQAHHAGRKVGAKATDNTAIPLCRRGHADWHDGAGIFLGWSKARRRDFATVAIAATRLLVKGMGLP